MQKTMNLLPFAHISALKYLANKINFITTIVCLAMPERLTFLSARNDKTMPASKKDNVLTFNNDN